MSRVSYSGMIEPRIPEATSSGGTPTTPLIDFSAYVAEHTAGFAGRNWCLEAIADWLRDDAPRVMLILGEPGCGKTALTGRLFQLSRGSAHASHPELGSDFLSAVHFCSSGDLSWNDPIGFAKSVSLQLALSCPGFALALVEETGRGRIDIGLVQDIGTVESSKVIGLVIEQIVVGDVVPAHAFNELVLRPLERTLREHPDAQVVLMIDALDESLGYGRRGDIATLATGMRHLHPSVRLLVSCRPDTTIERQVRRLGAVELHLSTGERRLLEADVQLFVRQSLTPRLRERISQALGEDGFVSLCTERIDGNFLYARYLLAMLEAGTGVVDEPALQAVPTSLDGIYLEYLERMVNATSGRWEERAGPLLGTLAVAREALTEQQLAAWLERPPDEIRRDITGTKQLLEEPGRASTARAGGIHALYHRSFADFLLDGARAAEFWCPADQQHCRIASWYLRTHVSDWSACDAYGLAHLAAHLHAANEDEPLLGIMRADFLAAKAQRSRSFRPVLEDLRVGLRSALRAERLDAALRMVVAHALLKRRVRDLPGAVIPLYAGAGEVDRALELAAMIDRPFEAQRAMKGIVERVLPRDLPRAATIAASIDDPATRAYAQLGAFEASMSNLASSAVAKAGSALEGSALDGRSLEVSALKDTVATLADTLAGAMLPHYAVHALLRLSHAVRARDHALGASLLDRAEDLLEDGEAGIGTGEAFAALAREILATDRDRAVELFRRAAIVTCSERENAFDAIIAARHVEELAALDHAAALRTARTLETAVGRAHALIRLVDLAFNGGRPPPGLLEEVDLALTAVGSLTKAGAPAWYAQAQVWLGVALASADRDRSIELMDDAGHWSRNRTLLEVLTHRRLSPPRALSIAAMLDDDARDAALLAQGRLHIESDNASAALLLAPGIGESGSRCRLIAEAVGRLARGPKAQRTHELALEVERLVGCEEPITVLETARSLTEASPEIAARLLALGVDRARELSSDSETWLTAADLALALHDDARALEA